MFTTALQSTVVSDQLKLTLAFTARRPRPGLVPRRLLPRRGRGVPPSAGEEAVALVASTADEVAAVWFCPVAVSRRPSPAGPRAERDLCSRPFGPCLTRSLATTHTQVRAPSSLAEQVEVPMQLHVPRDI